MVDKDIKDMTIEELLLGFQMCIAAAERHWCAHGEDVRFWRALLDHKREADKFRLEIVARFRALEDRSKG